MTYEVHTADCLQHMRTMPDNAVDAVVTDPPYGLTFMGKDWDKGVPGEVFWREALRVAKPGAHLLAFGGTRTFHRLTCAIEDAGWEIRDCIMWVYGSGFSKGYNLRRGELCTCISGGNVVQYTQEQKEACDESKMQCVRGGIRACAVPTEKSEGANVFPAVQRDSPLGAPQAVFGEHEGQEGSADVWGVQPVLEGREVHGAGKGVCDGSQSKPSEGAGERVCSGTHSCGGDHAGKIPDRHGRSAPQEPQQGGQQAGESGDILMPQGALDAGTLSGRGLCPRCGKLKKEYEGYSSQLKPAFEPIILARKPLDGTVASTVAKWGTGGLNVDGCRVGWSGAADAAAAAAAAVGFAESRKNGTARQSQSIGKESRGGENTYHPDKLSGRFPANLVHDGSEEVLAGFPDSKSTGGSGHKVHGMFLGDHVCNGANAGGLGDSGSAARFFYCAKASRGEREAGLWWDFEQKARPTMGSGIGGQPDQTRQNNRNIHPTIKPIALMRWLVRLVTPPNGIVLDPFTGSGTTGCAAVLEGKRFIGCELSAEYAEIARARIAHHAAQGVLELEVVP